MTDQLQTHSSEILRFVDDDMAIIPEVLQKIGVSFLQHADCGFDRNVKASKRLGDFVLQKARPETPGEGIDSRDADACCVPSVVQIVGDPVPHFADGCPRETDEEDIGGLYTLVSNQVSYSSTCNRSLAGARPCF